MHTYIRISIAVSCNPDKTSQALTMYTVATQGNSLPQKGRRLSINHVIIVTKHVYLIYMIELFPPFHHMLCRKDRITSYVYVATLTKYSYTSHTWLPCFHHCIILWHGIQLGKIIHSNNLCKHGSILTCLRGVGR